MTVCARCRSESSIFWWPYSLGCSDEGKNPADVFHLCDICQIDFVKFMRGCAVQDHIKVLRRRYVKPEEWQKAMDEAGPMPIVDKEASE